MSYPVRRSRKRFFIPPSGAWQVCNRIPIVWGDQGLQKPQSVFLLQLIFREGKRSHSDSQDKPF